MPCWQSWCDSHSGHPGQVPTKNRVIQISRDSSCFSPTLPNRRRASARARSAVIPSACSSAAFSARWSSISLAQRLAAPGALHPIPQPSYQHVRHSAPSHGRSPTVSFAYFRVSTANCLRPAAVDLVDPRPPIVRRHAPDTLDPAV